MTALDTPIHSLDARVKVAVLVMATVCVFVVSSSWELAALASAILLAMVVAEIPLSHVASALKPTLVILAVALLANSVRVDGSGDVAVWGYLGVSLPGAARGAMAVCRIALLVAAVVVVATTTTAPEVASAFSSWLRPLGRLGLPVDDVAMVITLALRFIPVSILEFQRVRMVQEARGARFGEGGVRRRLSSWTAVLVPVVVSLFADADGVASAMRDRCYGVARRTNVTGRLRLSDWALLVGCLAVTVLFVAC